MAAPVHRLLSRANLHSLPQKSAAPVRRTNGAHRRWQRKARYRVSDGGGDCIGVRPSSGAAMLESGADVMKSGASAYSVLAAPEDGRTPPRASPAVTDPLQTQTFSCCNRAHSRVHNHPQGLWHSGTLRFSATPAPHPAPRPPRSPRPPELKHNERTCAKVRIDPLPDRGRPDSPGGSDG
jgi:hypothetical protein